MQTIRIVAAVIGLLGAPSYSADSGIYAFVDRNGEIHLSNVPDDYRYRRLDPPVASVDTETRQAAAPKKPAKTGGGRPHGDVITKVAKRFGIDAALLHAVISVESGYNANAVSKQGAAGLMQLMPATAQRYGVADVFDPADNVRAGAQYLRDLLKLFDNDMHLALAAYNAGEGTVLKYGRQIPPYAETAAYVPKVIESYNKLR
ncbi:MAG: transglycosylase SLT domain-containing protein [Betaproteobacteria bacterium]|nr:transglycosylase SLT domain-containing protein [Betaproteobacteria bacterium]